MNHVVAIYEQTKKGLSYCYLKQEIECDGIHTKTYFTTLDYVVKSYTILLVNTFSRN